MDKDRSYLCLNKETTTNPYLFEESDTAEEPKPTPPQKNYPQQVKMNGATFNKVNIEVKEK